MYLRKLVEKLPPVGKRFEYLLNTGNLQTESGLDLSQASGFTVSLSALTPLFALEHGLVETPLT